MTPTFFLALALSAAAADLPWQDLALSVEKDRSTSSDTVTLCRVRVVNQGTHTWPGRAVRFEARVAFQGVYDRFEVSSLFKDFDGAGSKSRGGRGAKSSKKKRSSGKR